MLPLGVSEQDYLNEILSKIPGGVREHGLYVLERKRHSRLVVVVYSFHGSRFNQVLALLLQGVLGRKMQVQSTDFLLRVTGAGKTGAGAKIASALEIIQGMSRDEIGALLPVPQRDGWKFGELLPDDLFSASVISDYYLLDEFVEMMRSMEIAALPDKSVSPGPLLN